MPPALPAAPRSMVLLIGDFLSGARRGCARDPRRERGGRDWRTGDDRRSDRGDLSVRRPHRISSSGRLADACSRRGRKTCATPISRGSPPIARRSARLCARSGWGMRIHRTDGSAGGDAAGVAHATLRARARRGSAERLTMFGLPLAFAAPAVLAALVGLVGLYFLLRVTPPRPREAISRRCGCSSGSIRTRRRRPARLGRSWRCDSRSARRSFSPWREPLWNSFAALSGSGPLLVLIDDGLAAAPAWDKRIAFARERAAGGGAVGSNCRDRRPLAGRPGHRAARQIRASKAGCARWRRFPTRPTARPRCRRSSAFSPASRRPKSSGSPTGSNSAAPAPFRPASRRSPTRSRSRPTAEARSRSPAPTTRRAR